MHLPSGCHHRWCPHVLVFPPKVFSLALLSLEPAAKHQWDANTADGNALTGKSSVPILLTFQKQAASGGGTRAAGRTQHWEPNVNSALCYWRVSTMKLLITQALIKDLGGAPR